MSLDFWILIALVALLTLAAVVYYGLIVGWMLVLRRMAKAGIRSWEDLEDEDADLRPRF